MQSYVEPIMEILVIGQSDVVCTSGLYENEKGDDDFGSINDLL